MKKIEIETDCTENGIHIHKDMEIIFTLQGRCAVFMENKNFILKSEDITVFNPFESHQLYREEGSHTLSFYIPLDILSETKTGTIECISPLQPEKKVHCDLLKMRLAEIFRDYVEDYESRKLNIQAELLELISILQQNFFCEQTDPLLLKADSSDKSSRQQNILRYIWEHYNEPLTLQQTANHFFLSEGHFSRLFHQISGKTFSSYLRNVRLFYAKQKIQEGVTSVTELSLSCGFGNVNTFIESFRKEYKKTPGSFIRSQKETSALLFKPEKSSLTHKISYMSLFRYQTIEKKDSLLCQADSETICANLAIPKHPFVPTFKKIIGAGYAKDILFEVVQRILLRSIEEIGFEGLLIHGIFSDELGICKKDSNGILKFNFTYIDIILDFLIEKLHVIPWIVLDYTPQCLVKNENLRLFGNHIINLPDNLDEWSELIVTILKHMVETYGIQQVANWKFSIEQAIQVSVGNCDMEEYKAFYLASYKAIKSVLPTASVFGFGLDTGFVGLQNHRELEDLLSFAKENNCVPDILCFQCFFCDYSKIEDKKIDINNTEDEVYPLSEDEDILSKELKKIMKIMNSYRINVPIAILGANLGMWGRNPGNDTCFQSAAFVKNVIENRNLLMAFTTGLISDYPEKLLPVKSMFHGGLGQFTYNGIPKASYVGLKLLSQVKGNVITEGNGYLLTSTPDRKQFYLLLYYYCPYNLERHRKKALSPIEERNYDRYYEFEDLGAKSIHVFLEGLLSGKYILETHYVNRESGSSYDIWMKMGSPNHMNQSLLNYLESRSICEVYIDTANIKEDEKMVMSVFLEPHEVRIIHGTFDEHAK